MLKLHELCGYILVKMPTKYTHPVRWYNRWVWRFGYQNAIKRLRGFGETEPKECSLCHNTGFLSGMGHRYPDCPVCAAKEQTP